MALAATVLGVVSILLAVLAIALVLVLSLALVAVGKRIDALDLDAAARAGRALRREFDARANARRERGGRVIVTEQGEP